MSPAAAQFVDAARIVVIGGGIESDVTVQRLGGESYLMVTGTGQLARDFAWLRRHLHADERVVLSDATSREAVIGVAGPRSRELLTRVSSSDLSSIDFAPYTCKEIDVGYAVARAVRLSYTGELAWELYVPTEFAASVYQSVVTAGTDFNLRNVGTLALNSLRVERGFRAWGHELDADTTPLEAGVGFVARTDKPSDFIGRDAILRQREEGTKRRLVFATIEDPEAYPIGSEPIFHDGEVVGQVTSAFFGHTVGRAVVMGYVSGAHEEIAQRIASGGFGVEIACRHFTANASFDAPLATRSST